MENEAMQTKGQPTNKSNKGEDGKCKLIIIVILAILLLVFIIVLIATAATDARIKEKQREDIKDLNAKSAQEKNGSSTAALNELKMENARLNETLKNKTSALSELKMENARLNETLKNKTSDASKEAMKLREQIVKANATIKGLNNKIASTPSKNSCAGRTLKYLGTVDGAAINRNVSMDGDWIVIQRRQDGCTAFARKWSYYKAGFGSPCGDYWLGLEAIYQLTINGTYELKIDTVRKRNGLGYYAAYSSFRLDNEAGKYALHLSGYSGNATDSLTTSISSQTWGIINNQKFSTFDADNDATSAAFCSARHGGGWWHHSCSITNLNGYYDGETYDGIYWTNATSGAMEMLSFAEMKIKKRI